MARIFYPRSEKLRLLLESVHHREVALPDFQPKASSLLQSCSRETELMWRVQLAVAGSAGSAFPSVSFKGVIW